MTVYRGRSITGEQIAFIRRLISDRPELSRWKLSRELCEAWQWKQANGALRDMVCRGLLFMLHRAGEIELPPVRRVVRNRIAERARPARVELEDRPLRGSLGELQPVEFAQVRRSPEEALFNSLIEQHHYLGYEQPVGEHLKYLVKGQRPGDRVSGVVERTAALEAARPLPGLERGSARAQYAFAGLQHALSDSAVGAVPHLASHILGRMAKLVPRDWQRLYAHPVYWLETFVDTSRFAGRVIARPTGR